MVRVLPLLIRLLCTSLLAVGHGVIGAGRLTGPASHRGRHGGHGRGRLPTHHQRVLVVIGHVIRRITVGIVHVVVVHLLVLPCGGCRSVLLLRVALGQSVDELVRTHDFLSLYFSICSEENWQLFIHFHLLSSDSFDCLQLSDYYFGHAARSTRHNFFRVS